MTVNGMMLFSKVFLGMMIFFLIATVVVFFSLDVRKAWRILTGKRTPAQSMKKASDKTEHSRVSKAANRESGIKEVAMQTQRAVMDSLTETGAEATTQLQTNESINNNYEGYHPTTVLMDSLGETTVLADGAAETTVLAQQQDNSDDIVMDITFIHTKITL